MHEGLSSSGHINGRSAHGCELIHETRQKLIGKSHTLYRSRVFSLLQEIRVTPTPYAIAITVVCRINLDHVGPCVRMLLIHHAEDLLVFLDLSPRIQSFTSFPKSGVETIALNARSYFIRYTHRSGQGSRFAVVAESMFQHELRIVEAYPQGPE